MAVCWAGRLKICVYGAEQGCCHVRNGFMAGCWEGWSASRVRIKVIMRGC